jgi:hypothetical protein
MAAEKLCCERSTRPRPCWPSGCEQENAAAAFSSRNNGRQSFFAAFEYPRSSAPSAENTPISDNQCPSVVKNPIRNIRVNLRPSAVSKSFSAIYQ